MQKNIVTILIMLIIALHSSVVCAQYEVSGNNVKVPPGMVKKKIGAANIIVPEGSWVRKEGDKLITEDLSVYTSRRFKEIESHLAAIDADLEAIHKELQESKNSVQQK